MTPTPASAAFEVLEHPAPTTPARRSELIASPAFGSVFTDHLAKATWTVDQGWEHRRVEPFADLALHPGATVLHYGQQVFEGLKAYRWQDGSIRVFRPGANAARFAASARRMALPELSEEDFLASITALVGVDRDWVPANDETSLYLRPLLIGTEACLGVRPSTRVEYVLMACPVGAYFPSGVKPVSIWVAQDFHRAGPGGTGTAKSSGNYAASLLPQQQAYDHGCSQVLFLDSRHNTYIEELGGMNIVAIMADGSVLTPRLSGTILEGVTRMSVVELLRNQGRGVTERDITLDELRTGIADGSVAELFACGTAAVITPVERLVSPDFTVTVGDGQAGAITMSLRQQLTDIHYGHADDALGWMTRVG